MSNIKPISYLRNNEIHEYDKLKASLKLMSVLAHGDQAGKEKGWMTIDELETELGIENV